MKNKMKVRHVIVKTGADVYTPFAIVFGFLLAPKTPEPVHRPLGTSIPVVIIEP